MKSKKAAKYILKHPEMFTDGDVIYAQRWLSEKKNRKLAKKLNEKQSEIDLSHTRR
jgi:hypothetical protein